MNLFFERNKLKRPNIVSLSQSSLLYPKYDDETNSYTAIYHFLNVEISSIDDSMNTDNSCTNSSTNMSSVYKKLIDYLTLFKRKAMDHEILYNILTLFYSYWKQLPFDVSHIVLIYVSDLFGFIISIYGDFAAQNEKCNNLLKDLLGLISNMQEKDNSKIMLYTTQLSALSTLFNKLVKNTCNTLCISVDGMTSQFLSHASDILIYYSENDQSHSEHIHFILLPIDMCVLDLTFCYVQNKDWCARFGLDWILLHIRGLVKRNVVKSRMNNSNMIITNYFLQLWTLWDMFVCCKCDTEYVQSLQEMYEKEISCADIQTLLDLICKVSSNQNCTLFSTNDYSKTKNHSYHQKKMNAMIDVFFACMYILTLVKRTFSKQLFYLFEWKNIDDYIDYLLIQLCNQFQKQCYAIKLLFDVEMNTHNKSQQFRLIYMITNHYMSIQNKKLSLFSAFKHPVISLSLSPFMLFTPSTYIERYYSYNATVNNHEGESGRRKEYVFCLWDHAEALQKNISQNCVSLNTSRFSEFVSLMILFDFFIHLENGSILCKLFTVINRIVFFTNQYPQIEPQWRKELDVNVLYSDSSLSSFLQQLYHVLQNLLDNCLSNVTSMHDSSSLHGVLDDHNNKKDIIWHIPVQWMILECSQLVLHGKPFSLCPSVLPQRQQTYKEEYCYVLECLILCDMYKFIKSKNNFDAQCPKRIQQHILSIFNQYIAPKAMSKHNNNQTKIELNVENVRKWCMYLYQLLTIQSFSTESKSALCDVSDKWRNAGDDEDSCFSLMMLDEPSTKGVVKERVDEDIL